MLFLTFYLGIIIHEPFKIGLRYFTTGASKVMVIGYLASQDSLPNEKCITLFLFD